MSSKSVRLRFAPSPTGLLHVGGLRTALYNYFYARKLNGQLILRIEDTDQNRLVKNAEQDLIDMLLWAGIEFDEGPHVGGNYGSYRQSERLSIYKDFYYDLIKKNHAYPCFYSNERLDNLASGKLSTEDATIADSIFKDFDLDTIWDKMEDENFVVRFKIPQNKSLIHHDLIKGEVNFDLNLINDPILIKSDGFPTYHFANVIDDHLMGITHVIRGEEWLPSIPKHITLYNAFDWEVPQFGHLPLLLNSDKTKLSKRKNDVSVSSYIEKGYTKEALINFLSLLGWHEKGDREIYSLEELTQSFSFARVNKSGAVFDIQKLNSFNNYYIKKYNFNELKDLISDFIPLEWEITKDMIELVKDKAATLAEFKNLLQFIFVKKISFDNKSKQIIQSESGRKILTSFLAKIAKQNNFLLKDLLHDIKTETNCSANEFWQTLRIAITGESHGPSLDMIISIYGFSRLKECITYALKE